MLKGNSPLHARVLGVNFAHEYAMGILPQLKALFTPLVGCQVEKKDGPLLAKLQKLVDALNLRQDHDVHVYRHQSNYSLAWTVKVCSCTDAPQPFGGQHAHYYEVTVYVGDLSNGVLTKIETRDTNLRTNFTVEEVEANRQAYREAKALADEAHGKLHPFGEYDR